jgi:plastocyanin
MSQRLNQKPMLLFWVITCFTSSVWAKTHVVIVRDNSFNPATVVIEAGDTVRWVNEGPGAHNIYSVGKFRCAEGCEADGGDGTPSNSPWVAEVTFRIPETIPYECQPHVGFGMVGTVVVQTPSTGTTHQIAAEADDTFLPNDLTVLAGDVLYVNNQGGVHNFTAIDESLVCADGCEGDGMNVSTSPTGFQWEFYLRLNTPGDIPFQCANPAHSNQTGILRVISDVVFRNGFESN